MLIPWRDHSRKDSCWLPWRKFRLRIHSEPIRTVPISVSEAMRIIPNHFDKHFVSCLMKNGQKSIWLNPRHKSKWIRTNLNQSELGLIQTKFSIRINLNDSEAGMILIENSVWINPSSDWFRLVGIHLNWCLGLIRIDFWPFFIKRDTKRLLWTHNFLKLYILLLFENYNKQYKCIKLMSLKFHNFLAMNLTRISEKW